MFGIELFRWLPGIMQHGARTPAQPHSVAGPAWWDWSRRDCVCVCVARGLRGRDEGSVGNAKTFLITICCGHVWFCTLVDTDVPASGWRFYKPKLSLLFSMYYYLFIHPLCAL